MQDSFPPFLSRLSSTIEADMQDRFKPALAQPDARVAGRLNETIQHFPVASRPI
jgi:hypothetical protein